MSSEESFDVIVVGAGSGGVSLATDLAAAGKRVALVAAGYVGGECPYVACMPSKSLLRSARARREAMTLVEHGGAQQPPHLDPAQDAWTQAMHRRDQTAKANQRDDSAEAAQIRAAGVEVVRGFGRLDGPGRVDVDGRILVTAVVVLDTGSVPVIPDIEGLEDVPTWTSDEALSQSERPARLAILGGGPIGCELAQAYSAFGTEVTLIDPSGLVPSEDPQSGALMQRVLQTDGVRVRLGASPRKAYVRDDDVVLLLAGGEEVLADRVLVVTGRRPATEGLGTDSMGLELNDDGSVPVDARCRVTEGVWAVGDVTGIAPYTHTANHQAGVVRDEILHRPGHDMTPDALPRAVFTEPPLAGTGLTEKQARDRGFDVVTVEVDLADVSRAGAEGDGPLGPDNASGGLLRLIADARTSTLVGAAAIGPNADSWLPEATLAIRARVPIRVLADVVRPFPTYNEAFTLGYATLLAKTADQ